MQNVTKFIFFDFDGVIIDSEPLYQRFWIEACKVHGFDLSIEQELSLRSQDHAITTKYFIDTFGPEADYETIVKTRKELMNEYLKNTQIPVKSGVKEVFEYIKNNTDIRTAIVSSSSEDYVKHHASYNGVLSYIDKIVSVKNHVSRGKPYPDVYLKALEFTGAKKEEVIVLEDSPNGVTSAFNAGLRVIFIKDLSSADANIKKKTIYQLDNIKELIKIIQKDYEGYRHVLFLLVKKVDNLPDNYRYIPSQNTVIVSYLFLLF
ncbi:MAG: HAD family phosphatase, partial [Bacilli bacterium]|nr:HAD family phosphatase [Bacilli bacterium]